VMQRAFLVCAAPAAVWLGLTIDEAQMPHRVFRYLGRVSYGIYAIHWPVYHLLALMLAGFAATRSIADAPLVLAGMAVIVVLPLAHVLTIWVDEPVRRWLAARSTMARRLAVAA
jgi:peptidoglycan/LPS O-acetylase OafA/YrhL